MNTLTTTILGTLLVSCLALTLPAATAAGPSRDCTANYDGIVNVGSGGGSCLLDSHTCVLHIEVGAQIAGGLDGLKPSLIVASDSGSRC
jgi:hypothetical protein